jgi:hypothetical protein
MEYIESFGFTPKILKIFRAHLKKKCSTVVRPSVCFLFLSRYSTQRAEIFNISLLLYSGQ